MQRSEQVWAQASGPELEQASEQGLVQGPARELLVLTGPSRLGGRWRPVRLKPATVLLMG